MLLCNVIGLRRGIVLRRGFGKCPLLGPIDQMGANKPSERNSFRLSSCPVFILKMEIFKQYFNISKQIIR